VRALPCVPLDVSARKPTQPMDNGRTRTAAASKAINSNLAVVSRRITPGTEPAVVRELGTHSPLTGPAEHLERASADSAITAEHPAAGAESSRG
jgi:hypothetical protein